MKTVYAIGVDVGGSRIKASAVDTARGALQGERYEIDTPQPATPQAVADAVAQIVAQLLPLPQPPTVSVGIAIPSTIQHQVALTAANIDPSWVGVDVSALFHGALSQLELKPDQVSLTVLNDADAAGVAETYFGRPEARTGNALLLTFGTGIGSALLRNSVLYPNTELGHLPMPATITSNHTAEQWASAAAKNRDELNFEDWTTRVDQVLRLYTDLLRPEVFIVGGGISAQAEQWIPLLDLPVPVVPAELANDAGIVGAALAVCADVRP